jgi:ElaA protein
MSLRYELKHFGELNTLELYEILKERNTVFIIEQNCPYQDCDGNDLDAYHVIGRDENNTIQSYCRLLKKGVTYEAYASIGRVITCMEYRGKGEGKKLMQFAINEVVRLFPKDNVKISAQSYAIPFYEGLGFKVIGDEYMEDDIPHVGMVLSK